MIRLFATFVSLIVAWCAPVRAQDYPSGTIRIVCTFAAGSGADVLVRFYANQLAVKTGASVIVENRVGAQGNLGTAAVAKAKPDGRTLLIQANTVFAGAPHLFSEPGFDPAKDFEPVAALSRLSFVFVTGTESSVRSIGDLVKHLRGKPDDGFYGATTNTGIVAAELLKAHDKLKTVRVPYKDVADALRGVKQGEAEFIVFDAPWVLGQVRNGALRPLALTSAKRASAFPDVPTMAELGYENFDLTPWWGVFAPAGMAKLQIDRLVALYAEIAGSEASKAFLGKIGADPYLITQDEMKKVVARDIADWGRYVKLANLPKQ